MAWKQVPIYWPKYVQTMKDYGEGKKDISEKTTYKSKSGLVLVSR